MWFSLQVALAAPLPAGAPEPVEPGVACPSRTWVSAGMLPVHARPATTAAVVGRVAFGEEVQRDRCHDGWARIAAAGVSGWVTRADLSLDSVGPEAFPAERFAERGGAERRVWAARFAALGPTAEIARTLHDELLDRGRFAAADDLADALGWPAIQLVRRSSDPGISVYRLLDDRFPRPPEGELTAAERAAVGVREEETWWVLPAEGPPVRAAVGRVERVDVLELHVIAELVPASPVEDPLVAARGEAPPAAWLADPGTGVRPSVDVAVAAAVAASGREVVKTRTWPAGETRGVRVFHDAGRRVHTPGDESDVSALDFVDLRVAPDGTVTPIRAGGDEAYAAELPRLERDLDGDGRPETVWQDCRDRVDGPEGARLAVAPSVCGC